MKYHKKGVILIVVITFMIVAAISSIGLYNAVYYVSRMQGVDEARRIKGYYAAIGAMRYGQWLLGDLASLGLNAGNPVVVQHLRADNFTLWTDLGLSGSEDITLTMTLLGSGDFQIDSEYSY